MFIDQLELAIRIQYAQLCHLDIPHTLLILRRITLLLYILCPFAPPTYQIAVAELVHYIGPIEYFKIVFAFSLSIKIHSYITIHNINRAYFAQQIVRCYDQ